MARISEVEELGSGELGVVSLMKDEDGERHV
jgi:hypothetical protein